jgi:hypothetical protein
MRAWSHAEAAALTRTPVVVSFAAERATADLHDVDGAAGITVTELGRNR